MSDDEVDMTDVRRDGRPAVVEEDGRPYVEGTFTEKNIVPSFRYRRTPAFSRDGGHHGRPSAERSQFEWFIEAIDSEEREYASNLRPVSYLSRSLGGTDDPDTGGA